ncbi:MAG: hypothetical protein HYS08_00005 [Chlamydiae bacterium]|nr:hypothetical protein [Chlamydiota bacterium]MBI3266481.1 hypothetical protein [Chlamydiota bacterium]
MMKKLIGGVLGGVVLFIWGTVSWMVLPWHNTTMASFTNEAAVETALVANAPQQGIYVLPGNHSLDAHLSPEEKEILQKKNYEKMAKGPFAFIAMSPQGTGTIGLCMIRGLAIEILAALLMSFLVFRVGAERFSCKVGLVVMVALIAGIVCELPSWNWSGFPLSYTLVSIADLLIGWFLAGLVIAKVVVPKAEVKS